MCGTRGAKINNKLVAIVSFGGVSTQSISCALYRLGFEYKIVLPYEVPTFQPTHVILSGGDKHVYDIDHYPMPEWVINCNCPVLGICYGMQLIAHTFGGNVVRMDKKEKGPVNVTEFMMRSNVIRQDTDVRWMNRNDRVVKVPEGFDIIAVTDHDHIAGITDHNRWWGVQYHPEARHHGNLSLFKRFLR